MNSFEERSKELIQELHEIEESLISDDKLKATIVTAGDQLRKVFGEGGYYDKYIQSLITSDIQDDNIILQNMISLNNKSKIVATNAVTNGEIIKVIKNTILIRYLVKNNIVPEKDIKNIQNIFKEGDSILQKSLESKVFDEEKIEALEKYVRYLSDHKEYLKQNIYDILDNFKNPYSLNSILSHELAHHIFKKFTNLQGKTYVELNEAYSFAIQKALSLFDEKNISHQDIQNEIVGLYKIMPAMKELYGEKQYMFMKSFIPLLGGLTIANAIGIKEGNKENQSIFNKSYDQKSYTGLFSSYDRAIENINNDDIKKTLKQVKITSLHQLGKCREVLHKDARDSIDNFNKDDKIRIRAKMFVRTLELLSYAGAEKSTIIKLQREYFKLFFDKVALMLGHDMEKLNILEDMYTIIKANEFKPQEMIDLIEKTQNQ